MSDETKWQCGLCDKEVDADHIHMHGDDWLCSDCEAEHRKCFEACSHTWEPHVDHMGDDAQYCPNCCTSIRNEDFEEFMGCPLPKPATICETLAT